tara:strand:+ start:474 stop:947 length:474 start_codon:yes stop_codon:yes gene_type:complete
MALVKTIMFSELLGVFSTHSPDPMKPGKDIAKAFANYLKMGQNAGGFTTSNVVDTPAGVTIGQVFASQLPVGASIGSQIASALTTMAATYQSMNQIGPPAVTPSHTGPLIKLFSGPQPSGMSFAKEMADILDSWTKTWVVSGLIPAAPPIPFSGPLS